MITGLNHITFAVSDLARSVAFYRDVLGAEIEAKWSSGAYAQLGHVWICLSLDERASEQPRSDYTHIAFSVEIDDLARLEAAFQRKGVAIWKENRSEGESIYFLDPDGHKLELHVGTLKTRLQFMEAGADQSAYDCGNAV